MYLGHIVEEGETEVIFDDPQHPYTKALLSCMLTTEYYAQRHVYALKGLLDETSDLSPGCPLSPRCPVAIDRCFPENPQLLSSGPDRRVACFVAMSELAGGAASSTP
jgi:oligopeptide/dipeptide ABC transporter ATP-binding protein